MTTRHGELGETPLRIEIFGQEAGRQSAIRFHQRASLVGIQLAGLGVHFQTCRPGKPDGLEDLSQGSPSDFSWKVQAQSMRVVAQAKDVPYSAVRLTRNGDSSWDPRRRICEWFRGRWRRTTATNLN